MRVAGLLVSLTILAGCATAPSRGSSDHPTDLRIAAVAVSRDGGTLWYAVGGQGCEIRARSLADGSERVSFALSWCPRRIVPYEDGSVLVTDGVRRGSWRKPDASELVAGDVLAAAGASNHVIAVGGRVVWRREGAERELGSEGDVRAPAFIPASGELMAIVRRKEGEQLVRFVGDDAHDAGAVYASIDSFDMAPRGDEFVFSAYRGEGFDVAISAIDGTVVNWIPPERGDEVGVTWAPRGNKVSYLIRRGDGTLVRTVHVPSSFQLTFETPYEVVRALAWEPRAERVAMTLDGVAASPHVDWVEYGGSGRTPLVPSRAAIRRDPERVNLGGDDDGILLAPGVVRYGEKLPLFVMLSDDPLAWDPAVRDLDALGGGILRVAGASWRNGGSLAGLLETLGWVAPDDVIVIVRTNGDKSSPLADDGAGRTLLVVGGAQRAERRSFDESALPSGGTRVDAGTWEGAMEYLRGRFRAER